MPLARCVAFGHKVWMRFLGLSAAALFTLTTCAAPQALPPQPTRPPVNNTVLLPPVVKTPEIVQPTGHWTDWPMEDGAWTYARDDRGSVAQYTAKDKAALVILRCDKGRSRIYLVRAATTAGTITVRTSSVSKTLPAHITGTKPTYAVTDLVFADPILDAMAFSRGRIAVELPDTQNIAIPVWSEIGRVVEDCRA
jgi:hypothetical protein